MDHKIKLISGLMLILVLVILTYFISSKYSDREVDYYRIARVCEGLVKDKLKSGTSYDNKILSVTVGDMNQYNIEKTVNSMGSLAKNMYKDNEVKLKNAKVVLSFSLNNSSGINLDSVAICEFNVTEFSESGSILTWDLYNFEIQDQKASAEIVEDMDLLLSSKKTKRDYFFDKLKMLFNKNYRLY